MSTGTEAAPEAWREADDAAREASRAWLAFAAAKAAVAKPALAAKAAAASREAERVARAADWVDGEEWLSRMRSWAMRRERALETLGPRIWTGKL